MQNSKGIKKAHGNAFLQHLCPSSPVPLTNAKHCSGCLFITPRTFYSNLFVCLCAIYRPHLRNEVAYTVLLFFLFFSKLAKYFGRSLCIGTQKVFSFYGCTNNSYNLFPMIYWNDSISKLIYLEEKFVKVGLLGQSVSAFVNFLVSPGLLSKEAALI